MAVLIINSYLLNKDIINFNEYITSYIISLYADCIEIALT